MYLMKVILCVLQKPKSYTGCEYRAYTRCAIQNWTIFKALLKHCQSTNREVTEMCNTAIEREFCGLFGDNFENCEKLSYEA